PPKHAGQLLRVVEPDGQNAANDDYRGDQRNALAGPKYQPAALLAPFGERSKPAQDLAQHHHADDEPEREQQLAAVLGAHADQRDAENVDNVLRIRGQGDESVSL